MFHTTCDNPIPYHLEIELDRLGVIRSKNTPVTPPQTKQRYERITVLDENGEPPF